MSLVFHKGDAVYPLGSDYKIIAHICNNVGVWGGGFTAPLTTRWNKVKSAYKSLRNRKLGFVQFVQVEENITVANMIAQVFHRNNGPPIRYDAVRRSLKIVAKRALKYNASIHMPRIGCGLAGGTWAEIEIIIKSELINLGIQVNVYDL
jgi:O-acetyl-ADP-ribose deacetylase (regulator of RNase III)